MTHALPSHALTIDGLRRITADAIAVYDTIGRAQTLVSECQQIVAMAEELIRFAGLSFLEGEVSSPAELLIDQQHAASIQLVDSYMHVHQHYADLKDAIYRLAMTQMEHEQWDATRTTLSALLAVDPEYRETRALLKQLSNTKYQHVVKTKYDEMSKLNDWEGARDLLRAWLREHPDYQEAQLQYIESFIKQTELTRDTHAVLTLQRELPFIAELPAFSNVLSSARLANAALDAWATNIRPFRGSSSELSMWEKRDERLLAESNKADSLLRDECLLLVAQASQFIRSNSSGR